MKRACEASTPASADAGKGMRDVVHAQLLRQACRSQWPLVTQTEQMWLRSANSISRISLRYSRQALGVDRDLHALLHLGDAGGEQLVAALDLHQAHAAGAESLRPELAEGWNVDAVFARPPRGSSGRRGRRTRCLDHECVYGLSVSGLRAHATHLRFGLGRMQTPAGHRPSSIARRYSSRK